MLDVDEDSRLGREIIAGGTRYGVGLVPNEQTIADMYSEAWSSSTRQESHSMRFRTLPAWDTIAPQSEILDTPAVSRIRARCAFIFADTDGEAIRVATTDDLPAYLDPHVAE